MKTKMNKILLSFIFMEELEKSHWTEQLCKVRMIEPAITLCLGKDGNQAIGAARREHQFTEVLPDSSGVI